jgi:nicotinamide-nucleotide adenylyltransferase
MIGLFVGRFQPFHTGHLKAIKWVLEKCDKIIIVIGSSNELNTEKNPFTSEQRKEMLKKTLRAENIKNYEIIEIPDAHDDNAWTNSILEKVKFDVVFTTNPWTKRCFKAFNIPVKEHPMFDNISATKIREMIKNKENWQELVPEEVQKIILKIKK